MRGRTSPIGAFLLGVLAGAVGSLAQDLFFGATSKIAPETPKDAFEPPEPEQREETATQTVARRTVEGLLQRGPLTDKRRAGKLVHYAFGAGWGALYGLLAASSTAIDQPVGAVGFGIAVWAVSDNLILPAFRLSAWPQSYPLRTHAYALAAHLVYGGAVWAALRSVRRSTWRPLAIALEAARATRRVPSPLRAPARRTLAALLRFASSVARAQGRGRC